MQRWGVDEARHTQTPPSSAVNRHPGSQTCGVTPSSSGGRTEVDSVISNDGPGCDAAAPAAPATSSGVVVVCVESVGLAVDPSSQTEMPAHGLNQYCRPGNAVGVGVSPAVRSTHAPLTFARYDSTSVRAHIGQTVLGEVQALSH